MYNCKPVLAEVQVDLGLISNSDSIFSIKYVVPAKQGNAITPATTATIDAATLAVARKDEAIEKPYTAMAMKVDITSKVKDIHMKNIDIKETMTKNTLPAFTNRDNAIPNPLVIPPINPSMKNAIPLPTPWYITVSANSDLLIVPTAKPVSLSCAESQVVDFSSICL